ncbi:hypothetical protein GXP70_07895 [Paenibacillus lycopersici]|uniref:Uncharacterized protein n=1 Tax=Paenibacillus lycopersici TaxID=2704462 RepID=A0A6C0FY34_9BACL|nr:hypothetical protein [Paenibacillus lycopersici]QHT59879.1 hypothetical protein GXP70_07895 [Paenibacillus lycopersici]
MHERIQVKLTVDLTQYLNGLVAGTEGYTIGNYGIWSRANDNFTGVHFPGLGSLDVLWSSLEIIDQKYLEEMEIQRKQRLEEFKTAKNITKYVGPRGGFKGLSFEYTKSNGTSVSYSNGFKQESEKLIEYFKELNLEIEEKLR